MRCEKRHNLFLNESQMQKDYSKWHKLKTEIQNTNPEKLFRERDIWWCSLGDNIGYEQDGKNEKYERPILIIRKFNRGMFLAVPLTSKIENSKFYYNFKLRGEKDTSVILSQIRLLSSKRLIRRVARLNEHVFNEIKNEVIQLLKE